MKKGFLIVVALFAALCVARPTNAQTFARRCCGGSCAASYSAASYGYGWRPFARWRSASYYWAPAPAEYAAQDAPKPCAPAAPVEEEPARETEPAPAPCAPVEETPAPCAPVQTCEVAPGEYYPTQTGNVPASEFRRPVANAVNNLLARINATRARYGVPALALDDNLQRGAAAHCENEARAGGIYHAPGCGYEITAQNWDAAGVGTALSQWLNSPSHRALLLGRGFTRCGVSSCRAADGRNYCTVRFQ